MTITATDRLTEIDGVQVRLWEGLTQRGVPCRVFVHRIAVRDDQDQKQFETELREMLPPGQSVPLRNLL